MYLIINFLSEYRKVKEAEFMKIAIITESFYPEISGLTVSLYCRLKCLSQLGHEIRLYAPSYKVLSHRYPNYKDFIGEILPGITVIPYPSKKFMSFDNLCHPKPFTFDVVEKNILAFRPDVISLESSEGLFVGFLERAGLNAARKLGIPITSLYHTNWISYFSDYKSQIPLLRIPGIENFFKKLITWINNSYDLTLVPSKNSEQFLKELGVKNTYYGRFLGIDISRFKPGQKNKIDVLKKLKDKIRVLYVGRTTPDKQIDTLLKVFDGVREATDKCGFVIVGGGSDEDKVRSWASQYSDTVYVEMTSNEEIPKYYSECDIFVTASNKENHPLTIWEAMASGLPVVGPNERGVGELVYNNKTGFLVNTGCVDEFVSAILRLATDETLRYKMSHNALDIIKDCTWESAAKNQLKVWKELIKSRNDEDQDAITQRRLLG